jgi:nucleoside-diphosphate-sugar epimerase
MNTLTERALRRFYRGKRVLVTGGNGFLGTNLVDALLAMDCTVVRLLRRRVPVPRGAAGIRDVVGDLREPRVWTRALKGADVVFHLAAQTSESVAARNPAADLEVNVLPMLRLLKCSQLCPKAPDIVFAGTVTEAGVARRLQVNEHHPDRPATVYDMHKLIAEIFLKCYAAQGLVRGTVLRLPNVYGPGPGGAAADRGVLNRMMHRALHGEALPLYGTGRALRDYLFIEDATRAFLAAGRHIDRLSGRHYVIGTGKGHTLRQAFGMVAARAALRTGKGAALRRVRAPGTMSPVAARNFVADPSAFHRATGWRAATGLREGIDRTLNAYLCES